MSEPFARVELHCGRFALMIGPHGVLIETDPNRSEHLPSGAWGRHGLEDLANLINLHATAAAEDMRERAAKVMEIQPSDDHVDWAATIRALPIEEPCKGTGS